MAVYAVGDVQGCYDDLRRLLDKIGFDTPQDVLWLTGDLVNRGPQSLATLRFVRTLGDRAITVLGNHDLHLLAIAVGGARAGQRDTLDEILRAPDRDTLIAWLRARPLLHWDRTLGIALVHAGLLPQWTLAMAEQLAREAEGVVQHDDRFFKQMYGDEPDRWQDSLRGPARIRFIINALTRLRFCDADGRMALIHKGPPGSQPAPLRPWYELRSERDEARVVFGHWSLLGARRVGRCIALDSGCLWGRRLTAIRLDRSDAKFIDIPCQAKLTPHTVD